MVPNVLNVYKPIGYTPLDLIKIVKQNFSHLKEQKIAYAGRLDPMAQGVLLLLIGKECKNRKSYERLNKEYEFQVLFGVKSDTYDALGIVAKGGKKVLLSEFLPLLEKEVRKLVGDSRQKYPPYSAVRVNGKPLFYWARENKLSKIIIPEKKIRIKSLLMEGYKEVVLGEVLKKVEKNIKKVKGDFRQEKALRSWEKTAKDTKRKHILVKFKISCSSGTYVRSIANRLGEKMKCGAIALSIKRTKVGDFDLSDSIRFEQKSP